MGPNTLRIRQATEDERDGLDAAMTLLLAVKGIEVVGRASYYRHEATNTLRLEEFHSDNPLAVGLLYRKMRKVQKELGAAAVTFRFRPMDAKEHWYMNPKRAALDFIQMRFI